MAVSLGLFLFVAGLATVVVGLALGIPGPGTVVAAGIALLLTSLVVVPSRPTKSRGAG